MQHIKLNNIIADKNMEEKQKNYKLAKGFKDSLYYQIKLTERFCKTLAKQLEDKLELPLTLNELTILSTITQCSGEIHQRDLAQMILKDRANTGRILDSLEEKDCIKRKESIKNGRRANIISITDNGTKLLNELTDIVKPIFDDIDEKIGLEELEYIKSFFVRMRDIMKETIEIHI